MRSRPAWATEEDPVLLSFLFFLSGARVEDVAQAAECWAHTPEALCSSTAETVVVQTCNPASGSLEGRDQKFKLCSDIEA